MLTTASPSSTVPTGFLSSSTMTNGGSHWSLTGFPSPSCIQHAAMLLERLYSHAARCQQLRFAWGLQIKTTCGGQG